MLATNDIGGDATTLSPTIPADAYAYGLYYYGNGTTTLDYRTLDGSQPFDYGGLKTNQFSSLYNGNIGASSMVIPIPQFGIYSEFYQYRYDQLNRLTNTTHYSGFVGDTWINTPAYTEKFSYDANGNIKTAYRIGAGTNPIDNLNYKYTTDATGRIVNNRLNYITDAVTSSGLITDLTNQAAGNYTYDAIGNLTADAQSGISAVNWNVYGKIQAINKSSGNLTYTYNSAQQRSSKTVGGVSTYYVRDAQGNTLAVYDNKGAAINWREQHLYGSNRLGMWTPNVRLGTDSSRAVWDTLGRKQYELSNHLGNVMATITDRRIQVHNSSGSEALLYLNADVSTAQQYYAFGGLQPGKTYTVNNAYRYGFNGKENDDDVKGTGNEQDYGMRIYDPRVGRFLSMDPITAKYPMLTPYQFASNRPIDGIDVDGKEYGTVHVNVYPNKGDAATTYTYSSYDPAQSNVAGPSGPGVMYDITVHIKNADGSNGSYTYGHFKARNETRLFGVFKTDYGNYYGATPLLKVDKYGTIKTDVTNSENNLVIPAIDAVDQGGKVHDHGYDKLGAVGGNALFGDWGTTPIDQQALSAWTKFIKSYKIGDQDPISTAKVTQAEMNAAKNGATLFNMIVHNKINSIATFMYLNFKEAKNPNIKGDALFNYNLFLEKYLTKDSNGNYMRNKSMWNQDSKGNYTPKKPE